MSKQIVTTDSDREKLVKAQEELNDALAAAREGDPAALNPLYDRAPSLAQHIADGLLRAEHHILAWWPDRGNALKLYLQQMREDLDYEAASGLERLVIDQLVVCWLRVQQAQRVRTDQDQKGVGLQEHKHFDRRLEVANKSFLQACKTLAQVQRLLKREPTAQINILAQQQVNIATDREQNITE